MIKILVVDDEQRMRKLIHDYLGKKGYMILEASDGLDALEVFETNKDIDLILLDVMMPKLDGYGVLREVKEYSDIPVIMLTAKGEEGDELTGFEQGADEYITKPFSLKILEARIEALLRRTNGALVGKTMEYEGIIMDKGAHRVTVDGTEIELSFKEFELLSFFLDNIGIALEREKILNKVWNFDYYGDVRTIDTHVKKLRSKLGSKGYLIKTVWGMGYKFEK